MFKTGEKPKISVKIEDGYGGVKYFSHKSEDLISLDGYLKTLKEVLTVAGFYTEGLELELISRKEVYENLPECDDWKVI